MSTQSTQAHAPAHAAADLDTLPEGGFQATETSEPCYSLRMAGSSARCASCGQPVPDVGLVGYLDDAPVCDLCLLDEAVELGMVLVLTLFVRAHASRLDGIPAKRAALEELGALAQFYDSFAAKSWPARIVIPRLIELMGL